MCAALDPRLSGLRVVHPIGPLGDHEVHGVAVQIGRRARGVEEIHHALWDDDVQLWCRCCPSTCALAHALHRHPAPEVHSVRASSLFLEALTSDLLHDGIKCSGNPPCARISHTLACDVPGSDLRHGLHHSLAELLGHATCPKVV